MSIHTKFPLTHPTRIAFHQNNENRHDGTLQGHDWILFLNALHKVEK